ncbi:alanine racemase [Pseudomonas alloputida]|uniref:alanine racemase n=1 Tax=Pseudomonas TaxID=286 RepID=UPI000D8BD6FE|nr:MULTISPECIES: alanine racemase [Pseudomonas]EKT4503533.1 alanine racemase [Pseudomonas putida]MCE1061113.1 alanine racemase [Pseudomonas alloputida]PYB97447.1 amino acid deaminase [Pseudomonas sp. MB-090624]
MKASEQVVLGSGYRGVPPGVSEITKSAFEAKGWHPAGGQMSLPVLSLDKNIFYNNVQVMHQIARAFDAQLAPHGKTPMSPAIAQMMVAAGSWGVSVADMRQASVMLESGIERVLLANEIGGRAAVARLLDLIKRYPTSEIALFVDSAEFFEALEAAWIEQEMDASLGLLIDIGCGRGGVEDPVVAERLIQRIGRTRAPGIQCIGVAAYEGTAMRETQEETEAVLKELFDRVASAFKALRESVGDERKLILSAGGSTFFDYVIRMSGPIVENDPNAFLLLRSGACYFSDNGRIRQRLMKIADRGLLGQAVSQVIRGAFHPALRLWAEVISQNSDNQAICGLGLRDASHDQGLPVPLQLWRDGTAISLLEGIAETTKLNDQHSFVQLTGVEVKVGDVIEFGIRHPCTCIDKHALVFGLGSKNTVDTVYQTYFG